MTITDINTKARAIVDADTTSYTAANLLIDVNTAYEEIIGDLIAIDKRWKFDDTNYSDMPYGTIDLVAGQQDYAYSTALLAVERVEVLNSDGDYMKIKQIDEKDISTALTEHKESDNMPTEYALRGNVIFLYPAPAAANVTTSAGLKVYFRRTASVFVETVPGTPDSATKVPGFASPYHKLICYMAVLDYAASYKKDRVAFITNQISLLHAKLIAHYNNQNKDKLSRMVAGTQNNR